MVLFCPLWKPTSSLEPYWLMCRLVLSEARDLRPGLALSNAGSSNYPSFQQDPDLVFWCWQLERNVLSTTVSAAWGTQMPPKCWEKEGRWTRELQNELGSLLPFPEPRTYFEVLSPRSSSLQRHWPPWSPVVVPCSTCRSSLETLSGTLYPCCSFLPLLIQMSSSHLPSF